MTTGDALPDAGGAGALGLLSSPFGAGGFPSITGGQAGPSSASADSGGTVGFNNAFSVAGQGGNASATASPTNSKSDVTSYLLVGVAALAILVSLRK